MDTLSPLEKEWTRALSLDDTTLVLGALHEIRNSGSVRMLPCILKLLNDSHDSKVQDAVLGLISEIKTQDAVPFIIDSLAVSNNVLLARLLAACWQSSLDFSAHLSLLTGIFIRGDFETALEAFTVIEQSMPNTDEITRMKTIRELNDAEPQINAEKVALWKDLINLLRQI